MINGLRVKQAREIRKLTQSELAHRINVHQSVIAKMEADMRDWDSSLIESIALQLGFPVSFFKQGIGPEFPLGSLLFRCRAKLPANEKNRIRQLALLEYEACEKMAVGTRPIPLHFPSLTNTDPVEAAKVTRATLGFGPDTPIPHLINKLEKNGIFVFAVPDTDAAFEAFSLWSDSDPRHPVIAVGIDKPTDRVRLSCAHELGHLVLHRSPRGNLAEMEKEAYAFAAEFLMPEDAMRKEIRTPLALMDLARLKPRWGVSIQALIYRAHELDMLSDRQYRYFFEQITKLGWRKREPEEFDVKAEKPRLFTKLAEIAFGQFVSVDKVADTVCLPTILAQQILAIHAQKADLQKNEPAEIVPVPLVTETPRNNLIQFSRK
jgi:Zn-dependent peptidase ImmA (M78 family)/transcriptional regulator with XRE-family HTH domain